LPHEWWHLLSDEWVPARGGEGRRTAGTPRRRRDGFVAHDHI
jgi:hypothetical protein